MEDIISTDNMRERESRHTSNHEKYVIWALFDDGNCSYKEAIKEFFHGKFKVHCFGINEKPKAFLNEKSRNYKYHKLDLSLTNPILFSKLDEIKDKPDIILASPPCESWSGADCDGKMFNGFNSIGNWIVKNKNFYDAYNKKCNPVKRRYFIQKEKGRIIGENTIGATIDIINHYPNAIWVIENPATSKTWIYQEKHWCFSGIINKTYYSSYDSSFSAKPTIFKSKIKLNLKSEKESVGNNRHMAYGSYDKRSAIPKQLIVDIINSCLDELIKKDK